MYPELPSWIPPEQIPEGFLVETNTNAQIARLESNLAEASELMTEDNRGWA